MSTHTPGPWAVSDNHGQRWVEPVDDLNDAICHVHRQDPNVSALRDTAFLANARLIAAAPDLFNVAELVVSWLDEEPGAHKLCDAARAAIAKAKGEST